MIEFSIHQDYVFLAGAIILILVILKVVKYQSDKASKKKHGYGPIRVEDLKPQKVKEKTLFLENKLNQFLSDDKYITIKEFKKMQSAGQSFKILAEGRKRAIQDCAGFVKELEAELGGIVHSKNVSRLLELIKNTNKT